MHTARSIPICLVFVCSLGFSFFLHAPSYGQASKLATSSVSCLDYSSYLRTSAVIATPCASNSIAVAGDFAYVLDWDPSCPPSLQIVDISTPASPIIVGSLNVPTGTGEVAVQGDFTAALPSRA